MVRAPLTPRREITPARPRRAWATSLVGGCKRGRLPKKAAARACLALVEGAGEHLVWWRSVRWIDGLHTCLKEACSAERQADLLHVADGRLEGCVDRWVVGWPLPVPVRPF